MPPVQYTLIHPGAKLSDTERRQLADGLRSTIASSPTRMRRRRLSRPRRRARRPGDSRLADGPASSNHRNRSISRMNHRSCVTAITVPRTEECVFERLGARDVEVVRRLVEQEHRRALDLHQQQLEASLLAARQQLEQVAPDARKLVAVQHRHRLARRHASLLEGLDDRHALEVGAVVRLPEQQGSTRAPRRHSPSCDTSSPARSRRKCVLPVPFGPMTRSARRTGSRRRTGRAGRDREPGEPKRHLAGPAARDPDPHVLILRALGRRLALLEARELLLGRPRERP